MSADACSPSLAASHAVPVRLTGDAVVCERVLDALRGVLDAEAGRDIVGLGLVASVHAEPGMVEVVLQMARPTCPMGNQALHDAFIAVRSAAPPDTDIFVLPAGRQTWTPMLMQLDGRKRMGWD